MRHNNFKYVGIVLILFLFFNINSMAQVGIGTANPNTNAMLDVDSTTKGFLPPRMTTSEKSTLGSSLGPTDEGMFVFDTDLSAFYYWNGTTWVVIDTGNNYVDLTTNQTNIDGNKTFNGTLTVEGRLMIPMGEISYFNTTTSGFLVNITAQSTGTALGTDNMVKINPTSGTAFVNDMFGTGTNSTLKYNGSVGRYFHIALSFSYKPDNDKDVFIFGVAKTDVSESTTVVEDSSKLMITTGLKADYNSTAMHVLLWLDTNDSIEFFVGNVSGTGNVYIKSFNFVAIGM